MTKFKVGDKVRVIGDDEFIPKGTVLTVESGPVGSTYGGNYKFKERSGIVLGCNLEKVSDKPTKNQRITALEQKVADLQAEVEALKKAKSPTITQNITVKSDADIPKVAGQLAKLIEGETIKPALTPNQARKAIIGEAKEFVEKYEKACNSIRKYEGDIGNGLINKASMRIKFEVNTKKRTVVALLYAKIDDTLRCKGIAKCAPDDVFNADIGKAIALGRALGLDVTRFEQAVKPTEVVVGHTIKYTDNLSLTGTTRKVSEVAEHRLTFACGKQFTDWGCGKVNRYLGKAFEIIDDTEAKYE